MSADTIASSDFSHMPWVLEHGTTRTNMATILWKLTYEIRCAIKNPESPPRSPIPQMRDEIDRILTEIEYYGRIDKHYAEWVFASLDPDTIHLLNRRSEGTGIDGVTLKEIAPHITLEIFNAMMHEGFNLEDLSIASLRFFNKEITQEMWRRASENPEWVLLTGRYLRAARDGVLQPSHVVDLIQNFLKKQHRETWKYAFSYAISRQDVMLLLLCARLSEKGSPAPFGTITDPKLQHFYSLTSSAHGRLRIHQAIPDVVEFIEHPKRIYDVLST